MSCDTAKRGRGGHPQAIGQLSNAVEKVYTDSTILPTWQNSNPSGRGKRSERLEAGVTVGQHMLCHWFQIETKWIATPQGDYMIAPTIKHMAKVITRETGQYMSEWRVKRVLVDFRKAGYITSSQQRYEKEGGGYGGCPALRIFTKKFFLELGVGGRRLWDSLQKQAKVKVKRLKASLKKKGITPKEHWSLKPCYSPAAAKRRNKTPRATNKTADEVRSSKAYEDSYSDTMSNMGIIHRIEAPPDEKWSLERLRHAVQYIVDKKFGLVT